MKQETANSGSLRAFAKEKSFRKRLFDSLVGELRSAQWQYSIERIDEQGLMSPLLDILEGMQALSSGGEIDELLSRSEAAILNRVCGDVCGDGGPCDVIPTESEGRAEESATRNAKASAVDEQACRQRCPWQFQPRNALPVSRNPASRRIGSGSCERSGAYPSYARNCASTGPCRWPEERS